MKVSSKTPRCCLRSINMKAGTIEAIKEYLRSCHSVIRAPLEYIIKKIRVLKTYGNYTKYVTQ